MTRFLLALLALLIAVAPWSLSFVAAQDADEEAPMKTAAKTEPAKAPVKKPIPADPADDAMPPAAKPAAGKPAAPSGVDQVLRPANPPVDAILEANPSTPSELVRAAVAMLRLKQPRHSKTYLKKLIDAKPDDATLAALSREQGLATFLELALAPEIQPEGKAAADVVAAAVERVERDVKRIEALVGQLQDADAGVRTLALTELRHSARLAVGPLANVLADPRQAAAHDGVAQALVAIGAEAVGPLGAMLTAGDKGTQLRVARLLGSIGHESATPYLAPAALGAARDAAVRQAAAEAWRAIEGAPPVRAAALKQLVTAARERYDWARGVSDAYSPQVTVWRWDEMQHHVVVEPFNERDAAAHEAARLARAAAEIDPADKRLRTLALGSALEAEAYRAGLDKPAPTGPGSAIAAASAAGIEVVEDLLAESLDNGHVVAAAAAARVLGQSKRPELLVAHAPRPSPLAAALKHSDRRLRFAALEAVLILRPEAVFPGASAVDEALAYFAAAVARPRAFVVDGDLQEAQRLAALLVELGYDAEPLTSGRELLLAAARTSDLELVLIDTLIAWPHSGELIQQLQRDPRAAHVLVGVVSSRGTDEQARALARRQRQTAAIVRPFDPREQWSRDFVADEPADPRDLRRLLEERMRKPAGPTAAEALQRQLAPLVSQFGRGHVGAAERQAQAAAALRWLGELTAQQRPIYELRRAEAAALAALRNPAHVQAAAIVLAQLGTPRGQQALVELASQGTRAAELRRAAVAALRRGVARHGVLLTSTEIRQQYDLYNQDRGQDKLLGAVLDCLEMPR